MDNNQIETIVANCKHLKYKFCGVYAANKVPRLEQDCFAIVNESRDSLPGTHWLLLFRRQNNLYFADPLGFPLEMYKTVYQRLINLYPTCPIHQIFKLKAIQPFNSKLCGLYCIYIAHVAYTSRVPFIPLLNDIELLKFAKHML